MPISTILLLILSLAIAAGVSFYQYFYKTKSRNNTTKGLALLRFLSIFGLLLLLINPIFSGKSFEVQKTPLPIFVDNSKSITELNATKITNELVDKLSKSGLKDKYDVQLSKFDADLETITDNKELEYNGKQTNFDGIVKNLKSNYKNQNFPTIVISDGNQTSGSDYTSSFNPDNKVFPLVVGDTTRYLDLKVAQVNANKYAFHKNKFPVEVFLNYSGKKSIAANFSISQGNSVLSKQSVNFSPSKNTAVVSVLIPANSVGLQIYTATISSSESEKNKYNNTKKFAVEIIDQKTEVAIVSTINHPDIGALKRSIETNASRKVTIIKPNETSNLSKFNVLICYQPTVAFKTLFDVNKNLKINTFFITGKNTDFGFLEQNQSDFKFRMASQKEDYLATFEPNFNLFALDNIGFETFPPLENLFGTITPNANVSVLLSSRIRNNATNQPLMAFSDSQGKRSAYLFGENSWKWRGEVFVNKNSFADYDVFIDKTIQFLATNDAKKNLVVNHERFYNSGDAIEISAQYFNKNYELDENARLSLAVTNSETKQTKRFDFLRDSNAFKVNLDGLSAGKYSFTVKELNSNASYSGGFEVLDFDIEKQFVNADFSKMKQLASTTNGNVFMPNQVDFLIKSLLENQEYKATEKEIVKKTPLIDWKWLLVLIALCLSAEWFIRKWNGML